MKIRNGFVSNSSSSSFVVAKAYLTEEQIEGLRTVCTDACIPCRKGWEACEECEHYLGYEEYHCNENEFYFVGGCDHSVPVFGDKCRELCIDRKYIAYEEC